MEKVHLALIKKRAVAGVVALTSRNFLLYLISAVAYSVLGAYLKRDDFGIYAAVTAVMRITTYFTNFGFGAAIVQKKGLIKEKELTTAFTVQVLITFIIFLLFWLNQGLISSFFHLGAKGTGLLLVLIFTIFLASFKTIPAVLLERDLKFDKVVLPQIAENLVFNGLLIYLAINNYGIESYTFATLISSLIGIPVYYLVCPWKISFGFSLSSLKILTYGILFQAKGILATIKDDLLTTVLIVTKFLDYSPLGLISWWQKWAFFPFRFIVDSVTQVSFSAYSRLQHDKGFLKAAIEKSMFGTSLILFPILGGMMVSASYVVRFIPKYQQWEAGLLTFYLFCLNAGVSSLSNILINALDATGRVTTTLKLMLLWTISIWFLTLVLVYYWGYNGVAGASLLVTLTIGITVRLVKREVDFDFFRSFLKPLVGTLIMVIIVFLYDRLVVTNLIYLMSSAVVGISFYGLFIWFLCKDQLLEYLNLLKNKN